jgi:uncharacterized metal-binding protein
MPSGKTHDLITILIAIPTFIGMWKLTGNLSLTVLVTCATIFSGLMFGPDLDTQSVQYTRWGIFRFIWFPYKVVFKHRSMWSHGILFGTLIRVLYFSGVIALLVCGAVYLRAMLTSGSPPSIDDVRASWSTIETYLTETVSKHTLWAIFAGLWWGAASHTISDIASSMWKKFLQIF